MGKQKHLFTILILLVFLSLLPGRALFSASYDPSLKYRTIDTEHFSIHYAANIEEVAQRAARIAEEVHWILSPKYEWVPWGRTQVLLVDSSDIANGMASILPYNWVYIRVAAPGADSSMSTYDDWLRLLIMHEYTHILHLDKYKGFWAPVRYIFGRIAAPNGLVPSWIKEGQAVFEETRETSGGRGRASYSEMLIRTAVIQDKFLRIDQVGGDQWEWPGANARYVYGVKFLEYLAEKYGEEKLYEFIDRVSGSPLLGEINRQARMTFSEMEFETVKIHNRYVKQKKKGAPKSKTFYKLWKEWHEHLKEKYQAEKEEIAKDGLTPLEPVLASKGVLTSPVVSPDGTKIVYSESTPFGPAKLMIADIDGKNAKRLLKDVYASQISFSHDGKFIAYSKAARYKRYRFVDDLYRYDFDTKKTKRLTSGKRANDPDISPDGKDIVCVTQDAGTMRLELYNVSEKELTAVPIDVPQFTQFSGPRFSPDGSKIAVAVAIPGSVWDIYIFNKKGKVITRVTSDYEINRDPAWGPDGKRLYFVSDRTGISNIYRYNLRSGKTERVTNVLTGVFRPAITPDGQGLMVQYYNGDGYDIRKTRAEGQTRSPLDADEDFWDSPLSPAMRAREQAFLSRGESVVEVADPQLRGPFSHWKNRGVVKKSYRLPGEDYQPLKYESRKYSPLGAPLFLPRFIMPSFALLDDAFLLSVMTGGADPLRWHNWLGGITYRTDANYFGYFFRYWYNQFRPVIDVGVMDYVVEFGDYWYTQADGSIRQFHLFEKRRRVYIGAAYPADRHAFALSYFYEDRNPQTALTAAEHNYFNFGAFAGFNFRYGYNDSKMYQASISREGGRRIKLGFSVTNSIFGSGQRNEQYIFAGDWREYVGLWGRQVLAVRAAGGMTWGDELRQGTFVMGGSMGEGALAGPGSLYYFQLRGLPMSAISATRAMLLSAEYRFPLISAKTGVGTMPLFVKNIYMALFADYGNVWDADQSTGSWFFDDFILGTGVELRGDFVIGYGLPVTGRIGYGIVVVNRDRLGRLADPLLKHPAKDGILILQLGTSF